jgi:NAD(P)-dependent dehydrogenase (short-subunit alcohol dehydrogenase family)
MKTILLIGASSAIAKQTAKQLEAKGTRIISISRTSPDAPFNQYHEVENYQQYPVLEGAIDGLVFFPGSIQLKPFKSLKSNDFLADYEFQVVNAIKAVQHYLPNLLMSEQASVVFFSTVAVQTGMPFHALVSASKGAIEGLTRALAAEFAPKIRVNCIAPSLTNTPMASRLLNSEEKMTASANRHPLKKVGEPEDLANMVCFLLGDESKWISGQIMKVDGGMSSLKIS